MGRRIPGLSGRPFRGICRDRIRGVGQLDHVVRAVERGHLHGLTAAGSLGRDRRLDPVGVDIIEVRRIVREEPRCLEVVGLASTGVLEQIGAVSAGIDRPRPTGALVLRAGRRWSDGRGGKVRDDSWPIPNPIDAGDSRGIAPRPTTSQSLGLHEGRRGPPSPEGSSRWTSLGRTVVMSEEWRSPCEIASCDDPPDRS